MIEKDKRRIKLNKPTHVRASILELSKVLTYNLHYNYIKNKFGNKAALLFTDTNSLM